ncbi:MAG TPA: flagellar hook-associated protein FlgK, partial [Verrucomicrobiae bacterium]
MLGLFGTLNLGTRSLQTQQAGVEVTGQNLANVNNPAYSRQRLQIQTTDALPSAIGPVGTGAQAVAIEQLRNALLDTQIRNEQSVGGYWTAQQSGLQNAQISLGEFLDRSAKNVDGTSATGSDGAMGLSDTLNSFFNDFQDVATSPTSITERQALVSQAQTLASRLHEISQRLNDVQTTIQGSIKDDVNSANTLLGDIAKLNDLIATTESATTGKANDLRDLREQKLESLAQLTNIETETAEDGSVNISINGTPLVVGNKQVDSLETYAGSRGQLYVRTATSQTNLALSGGSLGGSINLQDNEIYTLQ